MNTFIGIDFGTTKTLISRFDGQRGEPRTIRLGRGRDFIPTGVYVGMDGFFLFGEDADDQSVINGLPYARAFKLGLGCGEYKLVYRNGQAWEKLTSQDLTRAFLKYVRDECIAQSCACKRVVITRSVNFSPVQIEQLESAARAAGFSEVEFITEPQAAGYAYCMEHPDEKWQNALVVDWGGGTLDMALISGHGDTVDAHEFYSGGMNCGGEDFDDALLRFVKESLERDGFGDQVAKDFESPEWLYKTRKQVCRAKEALSHTDSFQLRLGPPYPNSIPINREDFERGIMSYIEEAARMAKNLIASVKEQSLKPGAILLVGGSSRIPAVARVLERETGLPCRTWDQSGEAVSLGAAIAAFRKWRDVEQPTIPTSPSSKTVVPCLTDAIDDVWVSYLDEIDDELNRTFHGMFADVDKEMGKMTGYLRDLVNQSANICKNAVEQLYRKLAASAGNKQVKLLDQFPEYSKKIIRVFACVTDKLRSYRFELALDEKMEQLQSDAERRIRKRTIIFYNRGKFGWKTRTPSEFGFGFGFGFIESMFNMLKNTFKGVTWGTIGRTIVCAGAIAKAVKNRDSWDAWIVRCMVAIFFLIVAIFFLIVAIILVWNVSIVIGWCIAFLVYAVASIEVGKEDVNPRERAEVEAEIRKDLLAYLMLCIENYKKRVMKLYPLSLSGGINEDGSREHEYLYFVRKHRKAVEQGKKEYLYCVGICYALGKGVEQNDAEAVKWYRKATEQGHINAQYSLGRCYADGKGITKNQEEAIKWYRMAAEQGHVGAQYELGLRYADGKGIIKNQEEAVKWYRRAAEQGHVGAQYELGLRYADGKGIIKNQEEAVKWYRKAAEQGDAEAQHELGDCYAEGKGVTQDYSEAVKWYRKAAEQGDADAQHELGDCYAEGKGVTQNYSEAVKWYRKAAEQGDADAQHELGDCYAEGKGVTQDYSEAVRWYRKAAEQGDAEAQHELGDCYAEGKGVTQDYSEAVKWYRKAVEQGDAEAQCKLGDCYAEGKGVTQNYSEAVKWYRKAVEQGDAGAQCKLGDCYAEGRGVTQDYSEAVRWYRKAAEQGNAGAQHELGYCYAAGKGVTQDYSEAVKWYRKAAEQGDAEAQYNLGICYKEGIGVAKDLAEAKKWMDMAAEQGYTVSSELHMGCVIVGVIILIIVVYLLSLS